MNTVSPGGRNWPGTKEDQANDTLERSAEVVWEAMPRVLLICPTYYWHPFKR